MTAERKEIYATAEGQTAPEVRHVCTGHIVLQTATLAAVLDGGQHDREMLSHIRKEAATLRSEIDRRNTWIRDLETQVANWRQLRDADQATIGELHTTIADLKTKMRERARRRKRKA